MVLDIAYARKMAEFRQLKEHQEAEDHKREFEEVLQKVSDHFYNGCEENLNQQLSNGKPGIINIKFRGIKEYIDFGLKFYPSTDEVIQIMDTVVNRIEKAYRAGGYYVNTERIDLGGSHLDDSYRIYVSPWEDSK